MPRYLSLYCKISFVALHIIYVNLVVPNPLWTDFVWLASILPQDKNYELPTLELCNLMNGCWWLMLNACSKNGRCALRELRALHHEVWSPSQSSMSVWMRTRKLWKLGGPRAGRRYAEQRLFHLLAGKGNFEHLLRRQQADHAHGPGLFHFPGPMGPHMGVRLELAADPRGQYFPPGAGRRASHLTRRTSTTTNGSSSRRRRRRI